MDCTSQIHGRQDLYKHYSAVSVRHPFVILNWRIVDSDARCNLSNYWIISNVVSFENGRRSTESRQDRKSPQRDVRKQREYSRGVNRSADNSGNLREARAGTLFTIENLNALQRYARQLREIERTVFPCHISHSQPRHGAIEAQFELTNKSVRS